MNEVIQAITVYALPFILAITLPEAVRGYVARYFGDTTAQAEGRLTLNPLKLIDPVGTILIPLALALLSFGFIFGYAKPVPINFGNLRDPKRDMIWISLAGLGTSLAQALAWLLFGFVMAVCGVREPFVYLVMNAGILLNCILFAFKLLPLPPLDGGRIVLALLPTRAAIAFARVEPYSFFILMALILTRVLGAWMAPIVGALQWLFGLLVGVFL